MRIELTIKNIVLIGQFNPLEFDKYFFIKNKIVEESDILPTSVFNALGAIQLSTSKFQIVIQANQAIVSDLLPTTNSNEISKIVSTIIRSSNVLGITAVGFNFHYYGFETTTPITIFSKKLFYNQNAEILNKFFSTEDSRYGLYTSKNYKELT